MKASDYIAQYLATRGVNYVFELIGGMTTHMIDSISRLGLTQIVSVHHEQSAAFCVDGMGRMLGKPAVALATSGPGATNLITGIGSCYFDSVPAVFLTGQVNTNELKGTKPVRQLGFQETDIVPVVRPLTKFAHQISSVDELPAMLNFAFQAAITGRPGPTLLDIPMNIQRAEINFPMERESNCPEDVQITSSTYNYEDLLDAICRSRYPLILAGGGLHSARAITQFRELVEKIKIPVVSSLMAVDALPYSHQCRVGMIGTYGNRWANLALGKCDLLLVFGSRLDVRQTGSDIAFFSHGRVIYHFDCDPGEINNRVPGCVPVVGDLKQSINDFARQIQNVRLPNFSDWNNEIAKLRAGLPDIAELNDVTGINPNAFIHQLSFHSRGAKVFVSDVGQHQMWVAQSLELHDYQRHLTSGGMGAMGFALPTAIGASLAVGKAPTVVIAGDGGFQCNLQELQTVVRNQLPIKMVIMNNGCLGMVRQFQESYFEQRYTGTLVGYSAPDFSLVANAFGIRSLTLQHPEESTAALSWLWQEEGPSLLQVNISPSANAYPKIAFGGSLITMEPMRA